MLKISLLALTAVGSFAIVNLPSSASAGPAAQATVISEDFTHNPNADGWKAFGNTNLFSWNSTNQNLEITWDSSQPNSYYYFPLGTILSRSDDFSMSFDLVLKDVASTGFELTLGFLNFQDATNASFLRGTGSDSPNLAEFDYFPPTEWDGGVSPTFAATNNWNTSFNSPLCSGWSPVALPQGVAMHVSLSYTGSNSTAVTIITTGQTLLVSNLFTLDANFTDCRLNAFAVESYNDFGAWGGSVLAHGTLKNVTLVVPSSPVQNLCAALTDGKRQLNFDARTNWTYVLERTSDFKTWSVVSPSISGNGEKLGLQDTNLPLPSVDFYRVKAQRDE